MLECELDTSGKIPNLSISGVHPVLADELTRVALKGKDLSAVVYIDGTFIAFGNFWALKGLELAIHDRKKDIDLLERCLAL